MVTQVATKRINWASYHIDAKKDNIGELRIINYLHNLILTYEYAIDSLIYSDFMTSFVFHD